MGLLGYGGGLSLGRETMAKRAMFQIGLGMSYPAQVAQATDRWLQPACLPGSAAARFHTPAEASDP
jgi:hypothetical protein